MAIDPTNSQHLNVFTDDGMCMSTDGGASWANGGFPTANVLVQGGPLTIDRGNGTVYVGSSYNGAVYRLSIF